MTPPAKTLMGSNMNCFQGSIALCRRGAITLGFSTEIDKTRVLCREDCNLQRTLATVGDVAVVKIEFRTCHGLKNFNKVFAYLLRQKTPNAAKMCHSLSFFFTNTRTILTCPILKTNTLICWKLACWLRSEGDSNPRYAFDVYTLSRRASSATRASFLAFGVQNYMFCSK